MVFNKVYSRSQLDPDVVRSWLGWSVPRRWITRRTGGWV